MVMDAIEKKKRDDAINKYSEKMRKKSIETMLTIMNLMLKMFQSMIYLVVLQVLEDGWKIMEIKNLKISFINF